MRLIEMLNPQLIVGSTIASEQQVAATLRELYNSKPHITATFGIAFAALSCGMAGLYRPAVWALLIGVICLLFRIFIERRFVRRQQSPLDPKWIRLFILGSLVSGFGWGLSGALLIYGTPPSTQVIMAGVACAIVQGAAGRAYMMPGTAFLNITLVLAQISGAALLDGNPIIAPASAVYLCFLTSFIILMVKNRLAQLQTEQRASQLLAEVTEKSELLRLANEKLAASALEDPLTGLANRRKFDEMIAEVLTDPAMHQSNISLMMIDVDHFKSFNDTYGHQAGDRCLQLVARAVRSCVPDGGLLARYGGEEFVVLLPNYDEASAVLVAERARLAVQSVDLADGPHSPPPQTISSGLVCALVSMGLTREELLSEADEALYQAKRKGRNRVCLSRGRSDARTHHASR